eukprot:2473878-Rhodomonas_salina.3
MIAQSGIRIGQADRRLLAGPSRKAQEARGRAASGKAKSGPGKPIILAKSEAFSPTSIVSRARSNLGRRRRGTGGVLHDGTCHCRPPPAAASALRLLRTKHKAHKVHKPHKEQKVHTAVPPMALLMLRRHPTDPTSW